MTGTPTSKPDRSGGVGTIDRSHLLLVGAGPGLGMAVARRFAVGGYRVTLVARSNDKLGDLAGSLSDTGAEIGTIEADASDPEGLGARLTELYRGERAPGVIIYNAVMGAPDQLLSATVDHLQAAYAVDVISAIVVAQVAAPAMKAAGFGTMIVTGGGFADHPIPALATVSLGKAALRSAATMLGADWNRTVYEWRRSRSPDRSLPVLPLTRSILLSATGTLSKLTARGRRSFALPASSEVTRMRAEHKIAGEASNRPSVPRNRLGAGCDPLPPRPDMHQRGLHPVFGQKPISRHEPRRAQQRTRPSLYELGEALRHTAHDIPPISKSVQLSQTVDTAFDRIPDASDPARSVRRLLNIRYAACRAHLAVDIAWRSCRFVRAD